MPAERRSDPAPSERRGHGARPWLWRRWSGPFVLRWIAPPVVPHRRGGCSGARCSIAPCPIVPRPIAPCPRTPHPIALRSRASPPRVQHLIGQHPAHLARPTHPRRGSSARVLAQDRDARSQDRADHGPQHARWIACGCAGGGVPRTGSPARIPGPVGGAGSGALQHQSAAQPTPEIERATGTTWQLLRHEHLRVSARRTQRPRRAALGWAEARAVACWAGGRLCCAGRGPRSALCPHGAPGAAAAPRDDAVTAGAQRRPRRARARHGETDRSGSRPLSRPGSARGAPGPARSEAARAGQIGAHRARRAQPGPPGIVAPGAHRPGPWERDAGQPRAQSQHGRDVGPGAVWIALQAPQPAA